MKYVFSAIGMLICQISVFGQSILLPSIQGVPCGWDKNNLELAFNGGLFVNSGIYSGQVNYNPIKNLALVAYVGETGAERVRSINGLPSSNFTEVRHNLSNTEFGGRAFYQIPLNRMYGLVTGIGFGNITARITENSTEAKLKANMGSLSIYFSASMPRTSFYLGFDYKAIKINSYSVQGTSPFINNVIGDRIKEESLTQALCPVMALNFQRKRINWGMALSGYAETTKTKLNFSSQTFHLNLNLPLNRKKSKKA